MSSILFDPTLQGLADSLTLPQRRHEVLASNLANVETPRFKARDLDFEAALKDAFEGRASDGLAAATAPRVVEDTTAPPRADGNTVDLDLQMAKLGANGERYVALARILALRIALLRQAIQGVA